MYYMERDVVVLEELEEMLRQKLSTLWMIEKDFWDTWTKQEFYKAIATVFDEKVANEFTKVCKIAWSKVIDAIMILEKALKYLNKEREVFEALKEE